MSEIRQVEFGSVEMEYVSFGEGTRPFVLLPGISTRSIVFSAPFLESSYRKFASTHRIYVFDRKKNIEPGYTLAAMAEDAARAMREAGIRDADVFGASQGGMIAMYVAAHHPDLVRRMVLGSTAARSNPVFESTLSRWVSLVRGGDIVALHEEFLRNVYSAEYYDRCKRAIPVFCRNITPYDIRQFVGQIDASRNFSFYDELSSIRCPTLVLGAENDAVLTGEASREIAAAIGCECFMYGEPYGHAVFDEARDYRDRILRFLQAERLASDPGHGA